MNEPIDCPSCGHDKIRIVEDETKDTSHVLKPSKFTYCWCRVCGGYGPSAYNVNDDIETVINRCIERWNERNEGR